MSKQTTNNVFGIARDLADGLNNSGIVTNVVDLNQGGENPAFAVRLYQRLSTTDGGVVVINSGKVGFSDLTDSSGGTISVILSNYLRDPVPNITAEKLKKELLSSVKPIDQMTTLEKETMRKRLNEIDDKYPIAPANLKNVVDHIDHIVNVAGIDHVGIGCDFDGGGGIDGVFDVSQVMNITIELVKRGYNEDQIAKIWGGNLIRVFSEVQTIARKIKSDTSL